ncbi:uncharacterized protein MEPE_01737 [Melanopsichium pennsylvanicum]|uniref:LIM zinc-binding domain-containing protein n=2 Tax=Melanopsichium pennsylvanicum TaxID=63383 RepID=A0AAJ4XJC4_9BASI|nr:lim-domain-containing protein [Melanopsichium pennsylvanicum 4]SNX83031.1 uncharacterized protein MEPE_01737 [Melanopsichium pennsylvanicum]
MPRFAVPPAPKCARCQTSVYLAEQVIGPASKPYHKTCLTCVVCNKRLDSTLLVEHDGEPYCKNCHKEHLGTGKGGFAKAVNLNTTSPKSPSTNLGGTSARSPAGTPSRLGGAMGGFNTPETKMTRGGIGEGGGARRSPSPTKLTPGASLTGSEDQVPSISIHPRETGIGSPLAARSTSPAKASSPTRTGSSPPSSTPIRSIDEAIASGNSDLSDPVARLQAAVGGMGINSTSTSKPAPSSFDSHDTPYQTSSAGRTIPSVDYYATPSPPPTNTRPAPTSKPSYTEETSFAEDGTPITIQTRRVAATDTIGSIRFTGTSSPTPKPSAKVNSQPPLANLGALPAPKRPDPKTLTGASGTAKIAPPRTITNTSTQNLPNFASSSSDDFASASCGKKSGIDRIGLSSSIVDASGGTPLCARCHRPVYFAEQKAAAGRKWHRACLRCDGCNTTLESGKLEEGPVNGSEGKAPKGGANVWCRICYAKYFGPKGLGVGLSLPDTMG